MLLKKGISPVIATILIVLLTVVVAGIISTLAINFTRDNLTDSSACFPYRQYFTFEESLGYTCTDNSLNKVSIKAKAGSEDLNENIIGFNLLFSKGATTKSIEVKNNDVPLSDSSNNPPISIIGSFWRIEDNEDFNTNRLIIPKQGEVYSYIYNGQYTYEKVSVSPKIKINGKVYLCESSDTITKLKTCTN